MYTAVVDVNKNCTHIQFFNNSHGGTMLFCYRETQKKNILQDGDCFRYIKNSTRKQKSYWKCVIPSCKGRAITSGDFIVEKKHTADSSLVRSRNIETNLIKNCSSILRTLPLERKPKASEKPRCFL